MIAPLDQIAAEEFARRRAAASRKVAARELDAAAANALVLPWLAIACRAGADLPELAEDLADMAEGGVITPRMARAIMADDICPLPRLRETLRSATAAAILRHEAQGTPATLTRGRGLMALARHFLAGPIPLPPLATARATATPAATPPRQAAPEAAPMEMLL